METKEVIIHSGQYRNVNFSIKQFEPLGSPGNEYSWAHYIHLNLDKQIRDKSIADSFWLKAKYDEEKRVSHNYHVSPISDIEFHGGCTYYSKESSTDDLDRVIKIGCDYQHSWDDHRDYSINYIKNQVRETIDSLLLITPVMKWCNGCGVFYEDVTKDGCGKCKYSKDKY